MKEKSLFCGSCVIYDGIFLGKIKDGIGIVVVFF